MALQKNPKLLILGDSHVTMYRTLVAEGSHLFDGLEVDFWYVTGWKFNSVRVKNGILAHPTNTGIAPPMDPVDLNIYDLILIAGCRIKLITMFEEVMNAIRDHGCHFSSFFLQEAIENHLLALPGNRRVLDIRAGYSGEVFFVPSPLRSAGTDGTKGISSERAHALKDLYQYMWQVVVDYYEAHGIRTARIPWNTIQNGYLVKPSFNLADDDPLHKNSRFAEMILRNVFLEAIPKSERASVSSKGLSLFCVAGDLALSD